jgi:hypothetical protein
MCYMQACILWDTQRLCARLPHPAMGSSHNA